MAIPFFDISRQNHSLKNELDKAIAQVVDSGRYILGENVSAFEKEFAEYCGTKYAVGVASGTDALHLALLACGIKPGDEVITSPFTFAASAEVIAYCGAIPVFVDIDPKTFNLDASKIEEKITKKTKALLPVHLFGRACDIGKIMEIAKKHNLAVIEDCAQATGAEFQNKKVGSFGIGCFSFFPTKNLGCFGDGGMITTNDEKFASEIKVLRNHGSRSQYHHDIIGYNSRLDEIQAAILRIKLPNLDAYIERRRGTAGRYKHLLKEIAPVVLPLEMPHVKHSFNQFTIRVKDRAGLHSFLKSKGISTMVYYPISLHLQNAFAGLGYKQGVFPESEAAQNEALSLPIFPELQQKEIALVCAAIKEFYQA